MSPAGTARPGIAALLALALLAPPAEAGSQPLRTRNGMVVSDHAIASQVGAEVLWDGGNAVDAAVAAAFALAVVHPTAGNLGGGGFLLYRPVKGEPVFHDFRETAPAAARPDMFLREGRYLPQLHHWGGLSVGVPGSVAGLHAAWKEHGRLPWARLLQPAVDLASEGFLVSAGLARSLERVHDDLVRLPTSRAQFTRDGKPYALGDLLVQKDLARTLSRIAERGPSAFYEGEVARRLVEEVRVRGGVMTRGDLRAYRPLRREPVRGTYRGFEVLSAPPPSSGGVALLEMLNVLEGYGLGEKGYGSAATVHLLVEAMRRAYADRALHLGDPGSDPGLPLARLLSKEHAGQLRRTIDEDRASVSSPDRFEWPEPEHTTHLSVVDSERNAVSLTTTLEDRYGSRIVVPGAGFLLNNEMGDFNPGPGLTDATGLIGTAANLAGPGKRMLSSMAPTILVRDGSPALVLGSLGGRRIIASVLLVILNVVDFGLNVQEAVEAPRFHHQWLPDVISHEPRAFSPDTAALLRSRGHRLEELTEEKTSVQAIRVDRASGLLEAGCDRRLPDAAAAGR